MDGLALLAEVYTWLPLVFALDVIAFHATDDHPLALRWWWRRGASGTGSPSRAAG